MKNIYIILSFFFLSCVSLGYCQTVKETGYTTANEAIKKYESNLPNTLEFGQDKVTYFEFSNRVKTKYPDYKDVDDLTLAKKVVEKYPKYMDKVIFDQPYKPTNYLKTLHSNLTKKIRGFTVSLEQFELDMLDENKLKRLHASLLKRDKQFTISYEQFKKKMFIEEIQKSNNEVSQVQSNPNDTHFQIDKIKVGDTYIELPIPSGFVKVDDTMGILLEIAQKMCPVTNTLLAYYISEEDYANYLANQNHIIEEYIFVQVFNELKNTTISGKDYRKFVNDFKKRYVDEFKAIFDEAGLKITDNFLKIDEDLKLDNFKMHPFGICYESKNSISYGILSKYDFLIDGDNSVSQIVAAISTIAKIDNKPIFLFAYKIYKSDDDIKSLKAMNSNWIQEIDRRQSPASFIADIDFEDYKEAILAILTLSFIWAIYFATKNIHKKIKEKAVSEELEVEEKNNLFDFDELLKEADTIPNDLTCNEAIAGETLQKKEEIIKESTTVRNPELLKVARRIRLLHFLIDILFLYFIAYCSGYILVFIFGPLKALKIVEHTYLFGGSLAFIVYFSQEFIFCKTLGKLLTGTRVVDSLGNKPGIVKLIIRSACRLIPFEAFSFLGSNKRGWHDTISDTFVIKD